MARRKTSGGSAKRRSDSKQFLDFVLANAMEVGTTKSFHDTSTDILTQAQLGREGTTASGNYRGLDEDHVESLMRSIKEVGVTDPISIEIVVGADGQRNMVIVKGHHRTAAVLRLRRQAEEGGFNWLYRPLPCVVKVMNDNSAGGDTARLIRQTTSNMVRHDSIWEKADAYRGLRDGGKTQAEIAVIMGCDDRTVGRHLALLGLPEPVRKLALSLRDDVTAKTMFNLAEAYRAHLNGNRRRPLASKLGHREEETTRVIVTGELVKMGLKLPHETEDGDLLNLLLAVGAEAAKRRGLFRAGSADDTDKNQRVAPPSEGRDDRAASRRRRRTDGETPGEGDSQFIRVQAGRLREVLAGEKVPEAVIKRVLAAIAGG